MREPKFIIIKINSKRFYDLLINELKNYNHLNYFSKKFNGSYCICIKCKKYYDFFLQNYDGEKIYLGYAYLYTCVSIILSELIIRFYEIKITKQIFISKYRYLNSFEMSRFFNIATSILDSNFPSNETQKLYLYRKDLILNKLLLNFKNCNYIYIDHFVFFKLKNYHEHLEDVIRKVSSR